MWEIFQSKRSFIINSYRTSKFVLDGKNKNGHNRQGRSEKQQRPWQWTKIVFATTGKLIIEKNKCELNVKEKGVAITQKYEKN